MVRSTELIGSFPFVRSKRAAPVNGVENNSVNTSVDFFCPAGIVLTLALLVLQIALQHRKRPIKIWHGYLGLSQKSYTGRNGSLSFLVTMERGDGKEF